ncbi:hypothetical protein ACOMHN_004414 [Nucella lapillus]
MLPRQWPSGSTPFVRETWHQLHLHTLASLPEGMIEADSSHAGGTTVLTDRRHLADGLCCHLAGDASRAGEISMQWQACCM